MIWFILHHKKNLIEITVKDEKLKNLYLKYKINIIMKHQKSDYLRIFVKVTHSMFSIINLSD